MQQLFLEFPVKEEFLIDDFFVSKANSQAYEYITQWPDWGEGVYSKILLISAEKSSGKTHLANVWKKISGGQFIDLANYHDLNNKCFILEDIESIENEEALFHLINYVIENKNYLLLTSTQPPSKLNFKLPDLKSRILAINSIFIEKPDQELLKAVLLKNLSDRQLKIHPATIDFLLSRIERSFRNIKAFVDIIERYSKTYKKPITIQTTKMILEQLQQ